VGGVAGKEGKKKGGVTRSEQREGEPQEKETPSTTSSFPLREGKKKKKKPFTAGGGKGGRGELVLVR